MKKIGRWLRSLFLVVAALGLLPLSAFAAPPVVKTVPWVAGNPLIPHDTYSGKQITLKGTSDSQGANFVYTWDFGDGSPVSTGAVSNKYAIEAKHTYTGATGTIFTARLTVLNNSTGESASKEYFVKIQAKSLDVEANIAIDEGLWFLHKGQAKSGDMGYWSTYGYLSETPANVTAFEVNGHLETGSDSNPYVETVKRGLKYTFNILAYYTIDSSRTNPQGTFNPDTNANGKGLSISQADQFYQGGMFMDAIIASGTPAALVANGVAIGKTYKDVVQDMADYYNHCQYRYAPNAGGWRYSCGDGPDNSANQWAAIGYIPAERSWGIPVPAPVKAANLLNWLPYSQNADGSFGYTGAGAVAWGLQATTPSGMVQLTWNGKGRGYSQWDKAETYMRNNFCNNPASGAYYSLRANYYGLFSFTKSMLLHDSNGDGTSEPITFLAQQPSGALPLDWYNAEASKGDACDGVARTLINGQSATGQWWGHNYYSYQYPYETAQAIIMLNRTIYATGAPVAVATATPSPALAGQVITLNGGASFHQDPAKSIVKWEWDLNNDGTFDVAGVTTTTSWPALGTYPVKLRVTDNAASPATAETTITVQVTIPPIAPTANAGGSYSFCMGKTPWYLDGSASINPDNGQSEPGKPADFIKSYAWDLNGDGLFTDATGAKPDVTAYFSAPGKGVGSYLVQLKVTDNTATSFPSAGLPDLSDTDSAQVVVKASTDPACVACISNLAARPKSGKVQLTWTKTSADHYNVYRSTVNGGPYTFLATTTSAYSTYLDQGLTNGTTYYYIVREAALNNSEYCQSNQASAKPVALLY